MCYLRYIASKSVTSFKFIDVIPKALIISVFFGASVISSSSAQLSEEHQSILVLHSYNLNYAWTEGIQQGILKGLDAYVPDAIVYIEFLDTKQFPQEQLFPIFKTYYTQKYADTKLDVVIASDNNALDFVLTNRELFGQSDIVFCGINNFSDEMLKGERGVTGVIERHSVGETMDIALAMFPDTKRFIFITDTTTTGIQCREEIEDVLEQRADDFDTEIIDNITVEALRERLEATVPGEIVLLSFFHLDASGQRLDDREYLSLVSSTCNVPVFGYLEFQVGNGVMGGTVISAKAQGDTAAQLASQILSGIDADEIPIIRTSPNIRVLDYPEFKKWGLPDTSIPTGVHVVNRPVTLYEEHKVLVWSVILIFTVLVWLIGGLLAEMRRRQKSERTLKHSERSYQEIFNAPSETILLCDAETGKVLDINASVERMFGFSRDEVLGLSLGDFSADESCSDHDMAVSQLQRTVREGDQLVECRLLRKDGTTFPGEAGMRSVKIGGNQCVLVIIRDIEERKLAEETLKRFALVIEQASDVVVITDTEGIITYVNPAFERASGYTAEEAIGHKTSILKSGKMDRGVYEELWKTITSGKVWHGKLTNKAKDGTYFTEEGVISPLRDATGKIVSFVAAKRDITRELQLEQQFLQSQKMEAIGQLASGVAHDFNNLLQVIQSYSEMALEQSSGRAASKDLERVVQAADSAATLVRQLLAFSRKQDLSLETLNLGEVVSDLAKMIQRVIGESISFNIRSEPGLKVISGDRGQIEQILMNLCVNARDAMEGNGTLTLETSNIELDSRFCETNPWSHPGKYVVLAVTDTGAGMDETTQQRIFEPFFTTKAEGKGTGLGLATVFGIVRQHNGMINVESEMGVGTTFRIYFPLCGKLSNAEVSKPFTAPMGGEETILLADDDEGVRSATAAILKKFGYKVVLAEDGEEAIKVFNENASDIDLALLDMVMPKLGGKEVYIHIQDKKPGTKTLFSSGYSTEGMQDQLDISEKVCRIQKPYKRDDLLRAVRNALDE